MEDAGDIEKSGAVLTPFPFSGLRGFADDHLLSAFATFKRSSLRMLSSHPVLRQAHSPHAGLHDVCAAASGATISSNEEARDFFQHHFRAFRIGAIGKETGFLTGYYEPVVDASPQRNAAFAEPVYGLPPDLFSLPLEDRRGSDDLSGGFFQEGILKPYPDRAAIYAGALHGRAPVLMWLRDKIELFMIQVQGSARVRLPDKTIGRLVYAGRNGRPYSSIGRKLIEIGAVKSAEMSLENLKAWVRQAGQHDGAPGRCLLETNASYVFFDFQPMHNSDDGPIGGEGVPLTELRSIAVDRHIWSYGLPFWVDARLPWEESKPTSFSRLMIAQDTGSAILGPSRLDLYFGSGDRAGSLAGRIRHDADVFVLLPRRGTSA